MDNKLNNEFDSLAQRILYSYIATYPIFVPIEGTVSITSQKDMHHFMKEVLLYIYENKDILNIDDQEDDYFENWQLNIHKPNLMKAMEKIESKFANFIETLIKLGKSGEVSEHKLIVSKNIYSITKNTMDKLVRIGITCNKDKEYTIIEVSKYPHIMEAWKAYAENDDEKASKISRVVSFIYGKYLGRKYKASQFFGELIGQPERLETLEAYLEENHFTRGNDMLNAKTRFACTKWIKNYPKDETAYMTVHYDWRKKQPLIISFKLRSFRQMLFSYDAMDEELQRFIFGRLKTCDSCGYCIQTDKTKSRPFIAMTLACDGETLSKCPLYPNLSSTSLNDNYVNNMIRLLELSEKDGRLHFDMNL